LAYLSAHYQVFVSFQGFGNRIAAVNFANAGSA
jgi:hypothetical protein